MGIFDTLRCEYPLPDPRHQNLEFQTKDFDPSMESDEDQPSSPAEERFRPEKWGRRLTVEEYHLHAPEKLELIFGDVREAERLLLLVLTNLGLHRAALLVGPEEWRNALEEDREEAKE